MQRQLGQSLRRMLHWVGADRAVVYGFLRRAWTVVSSPVTMLFIALYFSRELQGYYYTFASLLALQVFVELGLGQVILQFASHEWSKLRLSEQGRIVGDTDALSRLVSLGRFAFRWYAVGGGVVAVGLGVGGFVFFERSPQVGIKWAAPWCALCLLTGVDLCLLSLWSLLEGCNQVARVYACQLGQSVSRGLATWLAILLGAGLWTAPICSLAGIAWGAQFLFRRYRHFFQTFLVPAQGPRISWRAEMLPFQWRIAVSWLSGYFCFSLFTPVLFKFRGAVVAGQMGMTWSVCMGLLGISGAWIYAKAPQFGMLVAKKDYAALDRLALRSGAGAFGAAVFGAIIAEVLVYTLYARHIFLAVRLLPPLPAGLLLLATVLMQPGNLAGYYLRAHKQEPLMVLSVVSGLLSATTTLILGWRYGAAGVAAGFLAVVALIIMPFATLILFRCRSAWHAPSKNHEVAANVL